MVICCCAFSCSNHQGCPSERFFSFPENVKKRKRWFIAIKREKWTPLEYSKVCSDHFITGTCLHFAICCIILRLIFASPLKINSRGVTFTLTMFLPFFPTSILQSGLISACYSRAVRRFTLKQLSTTTTSKKR